jgi:hypothetical protein
MLEKLVTAVRRAMRRLSGSFSSRAYGAQLGVYKTPARKDDSRHFPPNLNFRHEDFARECQMFRRTCGDLLACFFICSQGCGCVRCTGIPCALFFERARSMHHSSANVHRGIAKSHPLRCHGPAV